MKKLCFIFIALFVCILAGKVMAERLHTVQRGQTWYKLAKVYGCERGLDGARQVCAANVDRGCRRLSFRNHVQVNLLRVNGSLAARRGVVAGGAQIVIGPRRISRPMRVS